MITLKELKARQVLDSRGRPTVEVEAIASTGAVGRAIVPSGASTGRHEALELRDAESPRYGGLGVLQAVGNVTAVIAPAVVGMELDDQRASTPDCSRSTARRTRAGWVPMRCLGVSLAVAHAAAAARGEELFVHLNRLWRERLGARRPRADRVGPTLPLPMVNMISGGLHAGGNLDFQDLLIIPVGAPDLQPGAGDDAWPCTAPSARCWPNGGCESALVGDEGGYGPKLRDNEQAVEIVVDAMLACGLEPGRDVAIALDVASQPFLRPRLGHLSLRRHGRRRRSTAAA